ncbi:hypothetical protein WJX73_009712 [Symbiochloris irregularis]|uniref:isoamylase n=1 Tax=Symbiochloris irregularis TaxID=706552 RepID=A0AAW1NS78_9CHLO
MRRAPVHETPLLLVQPRYNARCKMCRASPARCSAAAPVKQAGSSLESQLVQRLSAGPAAQPSGQASGSVHQEPLRGSPRPLGASVQPLQDAVNIAVEASSATGMTLCLFTETSLQQGKVKYEIPLDPVINRTGSTWHIALPGLDRSLLYGFKAAGPHEASGKTSAGHRYAQAEVLLDPYAQAVTSRSQYGQLGADLPYGKDGVLGLAPTWPQAAGSLPQSTSTEDSFDWEGDRPLNLPMQDLIVYETHVRGFTQDPTSGVSAPGTYKGLIEKLDYLQRLGINCIELQPIQEFNELEYYEVQPKKGQPHRYNFWGYSTVAYFAPMARYAQAAQQNRGGQAVIDEFKSLVKECHRRGMEVWMDVVFNHTAEGNQQGPCLSFRGLDNRMYYMLAPKGEYYNYSGCGNTLNTNHPSVAAFIRDCLRFWVTEMHIDGFRFDLASILTRAHSLWQAHPPNEAASHATTVYNGFVPDGSGVPTGTPLADPPLVEMLSEDPVLRNTKLIAEAWDCDGLNQVGAFPHYGGRWAEWNGHFRDSVRQFIKGTEGQFAGAFATALTGSPHIYNSPADEGDWWGTGSGAQWRSGRGPEHSINFITAHDGFPLADLVAFNKKHNDANGEGNRDGESNNLTWNCGAEGPTSKGKVLRLRARQVRNLACALLLAHGVPMILMGDEYGHTKGGNNNTYCHDNQLNWFDWAAQAADATGFARFFRHLINLRRARPELRRAAYAGGGSIEFMGHDGGAPDWEEGSLFVGLTLGAAVGGLYIAFNAGHKPLTVSLPNWPGRCWRALVDTGKPSPLDFMQGQKRLLT